MKKYICSLIVLSSAWSFSETKKIDEDSLSKGLAAPDSKPPPPRTLTRSFKKEDEVKTEDIMGYSAHGLGKRRGVSQILEPQDRAKTNPKKTILSPVAEMSEPKEKTVKIVSDINIELPVSFDLGSSNLRADDKQSMDNLRILAKSLKEHKDAKIVLVGQTCDRGSDRINYDLSVRRSFTVQEALLGHGVAESQIEILGQGPDAVPDSVRQLSKVPQNERIRAKYRKVTIRRVAK